MAVELRKPLAISTSPRRWSALTLGVLAVVGLVIAFSLSSTLVKRADSPGVLVAFWRMVTVTVIWNALLWITGRHITLENVRQVFVPGIFFGLNLAWPAASDIRAARRRSEPGRFASPVRRGH